MCFFCVHMLNDQNTVILPWSSQYLGIVVQKVDGAISG